ncbi:MAG: hypothetical protein LC799_13635 [Actinobacteria bacterium]|nr:hypothetical protein [Actinomycetota bacterium]
MNDLLDGAHRLGHRVPRPDLPERLRAQSPGPARLANRRLLEVQRVGQSSAISTTLLKRVSLPTLEEGQRAPALRFGDSRVMALAGAFCALVHVVVGFTNRSLCARVSPPLGGLYTSAQMTYDLRRLRLKGLVRVRTPTATC